MIRRRPSARLVFRAEVVGTRSDGLITLVFDTGHPIDDVDQVVALPSLRLDLGWLSELRLELDTTPRVRGAAHAMIDPNIHSCGSLSPLWSSNSRTPSRALTWAGMTSQCRAPAFLARTGYELVRRIAAAYAGDRAAAARMELVLLTPEGRLRQICGHPTSLTVIVESIATCCVETTATRPGLRDRPTER